MNDIIDRLDRIEAALAVLIDGRREKDWYTTAEVGAILGRSNYTVREWCRKGQVKAEKAPNGRGWIISHQELQQLRNHGPLPECHASPSER